AKLLLLPIQWEEPFGLVMIEAMACGTPVIAFRRGSVPEIIKDGVTGFICKPNDLNLMIKTVKKIYQMPEAEYKKMRHNCRRHVEKNFSVEKMVDNYEKVYYKILARQQKIK
ncbi:MAG: glycosyltransferase, partial [Minisyncoccales bacterium]